VIQSSEIVFDLDTQQITGFKLKPWAEPFFQVRAGILERTALLPEGSEGVSLLTIGAS
jgi:hypothetical protein